MVVKTNKKLNYKSDKLEVSIKREPSFYGMVRTKDRD